jgi:hypothetical protein
VANTRGPLNSSAPTTSVLVGGVYNAVPPTPADEQELALQLDSEGNLLVNIAVGGGGGTGSNVNIASVGGAAVTSPLPVAVSNFPVTQPISGTVAISGTVPVSGTVAVSGTVPVSGTVAVNNFPATQPVSGTVAVSSLPALVAGTAVIGHVIVDSAPTTAVTGTFFQATQPVSGTVTATVASTTVTNTVAENLTQVASVALGATAVVAYGSTPAAANVPAVNAFITNSPAVTVTSGTVIATQGTGTNFHVVVDSAPSTAVTNAGTFAVQATLTSTTVTNTVADNLIQVAGVTLGATAVTAYGSTPAAANVPAVNAFITNTPAVTLTSTTITGTSTVAGSKSNNSVVPGATNLGVLPAIANAATQTWTEGDQVLESVDLSGRQRVRGILSTNVAAPTGDAQSSLNYIANAAAPSYTEGNLVLGSVDLSGNTRIIGTKTNNNAAPTTQVGVLPAIANAAAPTWTEGDQVLESVDLKGNQRIALMNVAGSTIGPTSVVNYGSTPAAVLVEAVNAFITNTPAVTLTSTTLTGTSTIAGNLTNNNAAPAATNLGVLPAIAETAYTTVTYTTGDQVLPVTDLHGALNFDLQAIAGTAVDVAAAGVLSVGITGNADGILDAVTTAATAPASGLATLIEYLSTAPTLTTGQSIMNQSDSKGSVYVNTEGRKATYRASSSFVPVTGATDIVTIIGSASTIVRVTSISYDAVATAATAAILSIIKRSVADTGGTAATVTAVPLDSSDAAATAVVQTYTASPTAIGAAVGTIVTDAITFLVPTTSPAGPNAIWNFGESNGHAVVLRGVAQQLVINLNAPTLSAGQIFTYWIEWTESTA